MSTPVAEGFFDFACPWSFLGFNRLREAVMRTQAELEWRPVSQQEFDALCDEPPRATGKRRQAYAAKDLRDWASYCGVVLKRSPDNLPDSRAALKGAFLAIEHGVAHNYLKSVYEACWTDEQDIADRELLAGIAVTVGLDKQEFIEWLDKPAVDEALTKNARELNERGGFELPMQFVGDDMYAGNARMPLVELALGQASDIEFVLPGAHNSFVDGID